MKLDLLLPQTAQFDTGICQSIVFISSDIIIFVRSIFFHNWRNTFPLFFYQVKSDNFTHNLIEILSMKLCLVNWLDDCLTCLNISLIALTLSSPAGGQIISPYAKKFLNFWKAKGIDLKFNHFSQNLVGFRYMAKKNTVTYYADVSTFLGRTGKNGFTLFM